jgi:hypothetical protein
MALQKTVITTNGFEATNAYHRVENIVIVEKNIINFVISSYKDAAREFGAFQKQPYSCAYDLTKNNPFIQAYDFVKTTPDFAGATDC